MSLEKKHGIEILYEDNHLIILNKAVSDIVQGDKTGDTSLDSVLKAYLKEREHKPGNVFVGIPHRLDRPVSGVIVFAKTSKALSRMSALFRDKNVRKIYRAITEQKPQPAAGRLEHFISRNERLNKSFCSEKEVEGSKKAILTYELLASSDKYHLLEINLETGRHHQIRAQLAAIGCVIKGDLKYGARRSNKNKGISLHAHRIVFQHPVSKKEIDVLAAPPHDDIFRVFNTDQERRS